MTPLNGVRPRLDGINVPQRDGLFDADTSAEPDLDRQFIKVVGFWAPRRWVTSETMDVDGLVAEIEEIVRTRGLVESEGQVITSLRPVEEWEVYFEPGADVLRDIPGRRHWGPEQHAFFGVEQPYQMADDEGPFTNSSVAVEIADPYFTPGELIAGVIHGSRERCPFTCPCHYAHVVYTTRHRLVCMSCGATHLVLREPVLTAFRQTIAPEEWGELFGAEGSRHHEPLNLAIVDVQDIESAAPFVWSTNQWDEALKEYVLCARVPREEFERAIRGTELDASIFLEDGWEPAEEPPDPAIQIMDDSVDLDMMASAGHALAAGASAYLAAYLHPKRLVDAVKDLFQSIELLLKVRLEASDPLGLRGQPNNPTVLTRLAASASPSPPTRPTRFATPQTAQRSPAPFGPVQPPAGPRAVPHRAHRHRQIRDRRTQQLAGDVIPPDDWHQLLGIQEIRARAVTVAQTRLGNYRNDPEASITACPRCTHEAMLRAHPDTGASCLVCGHVPVVKD